MARRNWIAATRVTSATLDAAAKPRGGFRSAIGPQSTFNEICEIPLRSLSRLCANHFTAGLYHIRAIGAYDCGGD
jgi:hypothetical protein